MEFIPVTISDLIAEGAELSVHCRKCGRFKILEPGTLPDRLHGRAVPSLERAFSCLQCGSRNTCAMPLYAQQKRQSRETGVGWIMPPAE